MRIESSDLWAQIVGILSEVSGRDAVEITVETDILAGLEIDSARVFELLVIIEDAFDISIEEDDIIGISVVGDIYNIIDRKLGNSNVGG